MTPRTIRTCAVVLGLTGVYVGTWALFWPRRFYDSFPGLGREWVNTLGPYNEHLARDVGGMYLAMAAMSLWAAVRGRRELFTLVGLGWLVFNTAHCVFHLHHLHVYGPVDQVGNAVLLVGVTVLAVLLLVPARSLPGAAAS